jgi:hypothetical protein
MSVQKKKLTRKQLDQKVLYFAYGSNMHQPRLEERVGRVNLIGPYVLQDYKLTFDTGNFVCSYANVDREEGETCEGVIYEMTYAQLRMLDRFEALYVRVKEEYNGRSLHIYISDHYRQPEKPIDLTIEYHTLLLLGCRTHRLNKSLAIIQAIEPMPMEIYWKREMYFSAY